MTEGGRESLQILRQRREMMRRALADTPPATTAHFRFARILARLDATIRVGELPLPAHLPATDLRER